MLVGEKFIELALTAPLESTMVAYSQWFGIPSLSFSSLTNSPCQEEKMVSIFGEEMGIMSMVIGYLPDIQLETKPRAWMPFSPL